MKFAQPQYWNRQYSKARQVSTGLVVCWERLTQRLPYCSLIGCLSHESSSYWPITTWSFLSWFCPIQCLFLTSSQSLATSIKGEALLEFFMSVQNFSNQLMRSKLFIGTHFTHQKENGKHKLSYTFVQWRSE